MPWYEYVALDGCRFETYLPVSRYKEVQFCQHGDLMEQVIGAPLMVKVEPTIAYDSPIDGQHITSWHARREDLKRHDCVEYDPEMKKDYLRGIEERDRQLDRSVDAHVEAAIERMPTKQRGRLHSELVEQGMDAQYERKGA